MKNPPKVFLRQDLIKLGCVLVVLIGTAFLFVFNPALSTPTLLAIVASMILSPTISYLERHGFSKVAAIGIVFLCIGLVIGVTGVWVTQNLTQEWESLSQSAPDYFAATVKKMETLEQYWKSKIPFSSHLNQSLTMTQSVIRWGERSGSWFLSKAPKLMGDFLFWLFVVPFLTFAILKDGPVLKKKVFSLVPNRFFETTFIIAHRISLSLSDYIRAKLIEACLLSLMTTLGLALISAPYAWVLGIFVGVTNIVPYVGPVLGAMPGVLIATFDPGHPHLLVPVIIIYVAANLIDMVFIFPFVVAKLVNLHPLIILVAGILGQRYYGLIGMLISIPIATIIKIIFSEIYLMIYDQSSLEN